MNSYPPEFLAQLAPVMFVAGLNSPLSAQGASGPSATKANDFVSLTTRLREALQSQRKVAIWQSDKSKTFQVIVVDKEVRFPPRKLVPLDDPQYSTAHSPLSPLTPTSPLHPDGLIAPVWIRKHTSLVPSVFVLFLRIYEHLPSNAHPPLETSDPNREREKEQEEKRRDAELAAEVALRKKSTNERGIKLTVVLMASRKMLDDPTLDSRLTYIRRQSGLDSRAALFVLSPVSTPELGEFIKSLQLALFEPALEYYTAHSKRVRRKRNRHSQSTSYQNPVSGTVNISRPLRPEGWTVRYEYKMACFAEFRGEDEVALKHYQDAYSMLVVMFGSTAMLPPRTKRWAEAKVLADCINVKISKLYLYNNEHALAISHHNTNIRIFSDFSRGWGIGEETFEYWSWIARQHRIFAELLEQGTQSTLKIPVHQPTPVAVVNSRGGTASTALEVESTWKLGINPNHALQHPGFYYYMAARCTETRRERFLAALEAESPTLSPGFTNEKKVDHLTIILELYTKAYESFKKYATVHSQNPQGRLTLWIAYRIAQTYYDSGKFDMAMRFFERIAKTYRRERWRPLLQPLLSTWYDCAQKIGDVELCITLLVESLGHEPESTNSVQQNLLALLKNTTPSSSDALVVDLSESEPIFDSNVVFWPSEIEVGNPAPFQLTLTAPSKMPISSLPFSSLEIYLSHKEHPIIVRHQEPDTHFSSLIRRVHLGHISSEPSEELVASLHWVLGGSIFFSGTISSDVPIYLEISKLILTIVEGPWRVEIVFNPYTFHRGLSPAARWLSFTDPPRSIPVKREESSSILVKHRPHSLMVSLDHSSPAYLQEDYPITLAITNTDGRELSVVVDVLLPPTEIDDMVNTIFFGDEQSSSFIKGVTFGILAPGATVTKTLRLVNTGAIGERIIDISIQSQRINLETNPDLQDVAETLRTLVIPVVAPFKVTQTTEYMPGLDEWPGLGDLKMFGGEIWDGRKAGEALVKTMVECAGPSSLTVESISMERLEHETAKIIECSADDDADICTSEYKPGDKFVHLCRVATMPPEDLEEGIISSVGSYRIYWRRIFNNRECGPLSTSIIALPVLQPPVEGLVALLSLPSVATLHVPLSLILAVRNHHPSRSANISVELDLDTSDSFVVTGLRSGRIPILMPGTEERLTWRLIPIECGHVRVPRIKVIDCRQAFTSGDTHGDGETKGVPVKVIEVWLNRQASWDEGSSENGTILVLP